MAEITLRGMSWDHRRAIDPLLATLDGFLARHPGVRIDWNARPLSGFEFTPVRELAERYDFIILDHPFAGDISAGGYLLPLDGVAGDDADYAGPSLDTYRHGGHVWAVPVDAATQVAASRPDLMARLGAEPPRDWAGVLALGRAAAPRGLKLAIGLKGVHSLMTFFSLMANLGAPCAVTPDAPLFRREAAREALARMRDLVAFCPPEAFDWNSIALHDRMAERDDLVFCPAVYCYATYAEDDRARPLRFHDFPGPAGLAGATIGGTGLGVSAHCRELELALAYARHLAQAETQLAFARHHGQPARREAWEDAEVNARFGGCYRDTRATLDASWVRPRYKGYLAFQAEAGEAIERHLRGDATEADLLDELEALHAAP